MKNKNLSTLLGIYFFLLISACSDSGDQVSNSGSDAVEAVTQTLAASNQISPAAPVSAAEAARIQIRVQNGFNSAGRPAADFQAHPRRKPEQVIAWAGITEGMEVIDIGASGGYYSENLAWAVGLEGWVIAQNIPGALDRFEGQNRQILDARLANLRLPQIEAKEIAYADLAAQFDELDAATMINIFHDVHNFQGVGLELLEAIYSTLHPGGFLLLIDHVGLANNNNAELHRIDPDLVESLLKQAGFIVAEKSDLLEVASDNPNVSVFDPSVRGNTNRFIFKAVKPAG
jgi:predicted methyltransferase